MYKIVNVLQREICHIANPKQLKLLLYVNNNDRSYHSDSL